MNRPLTVTKGFSLIELTVVLLIITLLASVAIRETSELTFQTRYEQTKERLERIKQAILGNPKQIINGQQAISGFVADMGRLPDNMRELLQMGFCVTATAADPPLPAEIVTSSRTPNSCTGTNIWRWTNLPCTDGVSGFADCVGGHLWLGKQVDLATGLSFGWSGPYLSISANPGDTDAFPDGWGRLPQGYCNPPTMNPEAIMVSTSCPDATEADWTVADKDYNYGWYFNELATGNLTILSYGKDHTIGGTPPSYDADYPAPASQTVVRDTDWSIDVSLEIGLKTQIRLPLSGTRQIPSASFCTDATKTIKTDCDIAGKVWFGGCEDQTYYNKSSCETAAKVWHSCTNGVSTDKTACETAGAIWYGEGYGCSDQTKTTKADCTAASGTWRSCTDNGTITTQVVCAGAKELWYGDNLIAVGSNGGCSDVHYTNKISCEAASKTWQVCSIATVTSFLECEARGGYWLGNGYGCSGQQYIDQASCETNGNVWFESWPRCKKTASPNTELFVPYHNIKTAKQECENDISGSWKYPRKQACLNVFYRRNGSLIYSTSLTAEFEENGTSQTIHFKFPDYGNQTDCENNNGIWNSTLSTCFYSIPAGQNAIGIYEWDGDCDPVNNPLYPEGRQNPIPVDFRAHTTLPVINW